MVIPFLNILFDSERKTYVSTELGFSPESLKENFYILINKLIDYKGKEEALLFICLLVLVAFFIRNLFRYLALFFLSPIRNGVIHDIRKDLHDKTISLPIGYFKERRKGDISSRMTNDLVEVEWSVMGCIEMIFKDPVQIIIYLTALIIISPELTLFVTIMFPVTGFIIARIGKSLRKSSKKGQRQIGKLLSIIDENISNLRVIKSLNIQKFSNKKFEKQSLNYSNTMTSLLRKKDLSSPMSEFLSTVVMVVIMWFGGKLVLGGSSHVLPEEFIAYILIFSQIIPPAKSLTSSYYLIQKGSAAAERIYEILDIVTFSNNKKQNLFLKDKIKFDKVCFRYDRKDILKNISFDIPVGSKVAIVGRSGSGKSTIADLLIRFYEHEEGEISIDGVNIEEFSKKDIRLLISTVNQESILFNDTILNNIKMGNLSASDKEVISAAKVANAHDFIINTEDGYQTKIGDRGIKLSVGQRQRIDIARTILKNPRILILDEATSSLDSESEKLIKDALINVMEKRTSLIISHRFSLIKDVDLILVIDNGEIIEKGTHESLIQKEGLYKKMYELQSFN
tara:strand:+ start:2343 stop:4043 length:1701 start_codon:yes stop_codon:yes gene_type:complete